MPGFNYQKIDAKQVPAKVRFDVPRRFGGQIVETAFGGFGRSEHDDGDEYMRVKDRSTGKTEFFKMEH